MSAFGFCFCIPRKDDCIKVGPIHNSLQTCVSFNTYAVTAAPSMQQYEKSSDVVTKFASPVKWYTHTHTQTHTSLRIVSCIVTQWCTLGSVHGTHINGKQVLTQLKNSSDNWRKWNPFINVRGYIFSADCPSRKAPFSITVGLTNVTVSVVTVV